LGLTGTTSAITNVLTATTAAIYTQYSNSGNNFYVGKDGSVSAFGTTAYASILYEAGNNPMVFFTSAAEQVRITGAGNVGIGTSSPIAKLDVQGGWIRTANGTSTSYFGDGVNLVSGASASSSAVRFDGDSLLFSNSATERACITSGGDFGLGTTSPNAKLAIGVAAATVDGTKGVRITNSGGGVVMLENGSNNDSYVGTISASDFNIRTNNTERVKFPSAGGVQAVTTIGVGNATPASSGAGITFPATQSASSNANTLDDYEEGTWTPAFAFGTSGSVTYTVQSGYYRKVGSLVFVECNIIIASVSSPTGSVTVNNLPFTTNSSTENVASLAVGIVRNLVNAKPNIKSACARNSTTIIFSVNDTISGASELQGSDLQASTLIYASGCFITD
jgi:hypothetical protein